MIQEVELDLLSDKKVNLFIKRLDLLEHPVNGNKWYKLKYNIKKARDLELNSLITFGGAFSNHLYAFAKASVAYGFRGIAYIRGDKMDNNNPTLRFLDQSGIEYYFVDRETYRTKSSPEFISAIKQKHPDSWVIPEGGSNREGFRGVKEILDFNESNYDLLCVSAGTGCTAAGIVSMSKTQVQVFPALKGGFMESNIRAYLSEQKPFVVKEDYNFGGFARTNETLITFINEFYNKTGIPLDPIYNGKMMYGILDQIRNGAFKPNTNIMAIHTGGLQGIHGYNYLNPSNKILIPDEALNL